MFFAALTPLLPQYAEELGLSKAGAGLLAASYALGALVGGIPGGMSAARFGVRPTVLVGLTGMAITTVTFGFADSILAARHRASCRESRARSPGRLRSRGSLRPRPPSDAERRSAP